MNEYEYRIPLFGPNYSNSWIVRIIRPNTDLDTKKQAGTYQDFEMIPCRMNSMTMKGVLVMKNTMTTVRARLVVFSLARDM